MAPPTNPSPEEAADPTATTQDNDATVKEVSITGDYLERLAHQNMNPKSILTGIYGSRGERVRHTVHEGAMRMPASAIGILNGLTEELTEGTTSDETYALPGLDDVRPPTMDRRLGSVRVIELGLAPNPQPPRQPSYPGAPPPQVPDPPKWRTVATTRTLHLKEKEATQRIRGGGDGDEPTGTDAGAIAQPMDVDEASEAKRPANVAEQEVAAPSADAALTGAPPATMTTASVAMPGTQIVPPAAPAASTDVVMSEKATAPQETTPKTAPLAASSSDIDSQRQIIQAPTERKDGLEGGPAMYIGSSSASPKTEDTSTPSVAAVSSKTEVPPAASDDAAPAPASRDDSTPTIVASSTVTQPTPVPRGMGVVPLPSRPVSQWEQHVPGMNDEMPKEPKTPTPSWYSPDMVSDFEHTMLPEWFNETASHRTPESYRETREQIIKISDKLGHRNVTTTHVRRTITGDAGSLTRLHDFLVTWGFINEDAINDSSPTGTGLREDAESNKKAILWNDKAKEELAEAVVEEANKRRKLDMGGSPAETAVDWGAVAARMQNGAGPIECERAFLFTPLLTDSTETQVERSITPDVTGSERKLDASAKSDAALKEKILKDIVEVARPEVVQAATDAALLATKNVTEAQNAAVLALVAAQATERALKEENTVSRLMAELQEQRMQKLENRLALLDDVEGMLEAERVALELERRDLYTARCRHWFGGS